VIPSYGVFVAGAVAAESIFIVESIFIAVESIAAVESMAGVVDSTGAVAAAGAAVSAVSVFGALQAARVSTAAARAKRFIIVVSRNVRYITKSF
jgi:hypothetical protein